MFGQGGGLHRVRGCGGGQQELEFLTSGGGLQQRGRRWCWQVLSRDHHSSLSLFLLYSYSSSSSEYFRLQDDIIVNLYHWFIMREVTLDTETTGLNRRRNGGTVSDGHRVIEIGCVEIVDRKVTGRTFHTYLKPDCVVDPKAVKVHGITDEFLEDKPVFGDVVEEFLEFLEGATLIIHNAAFDTVFLDKEFGLLDESKQPLERVFFVVDTLKVSRQLYPNRSNTLRSLAERFDIETEEKHGALADAAILARVYLGMCGDHKIL